MAGRQILGAAEVVTAAYVNDKLMDQGIMRFASAAARTTAIPSPTSGMWTWRDDHAGPVKLEYWNGASWAGITLTSPAQTVTGMTSVQQLTTITPDAAADTWSTWQSIGTSPASTSYLTGLRLNGTGLASPAAFVVELSLDGGTTVWRRALGSSSTLTAGPAQCVTARSCATSSTIHARAKVSIASATGVIVNLYWSQTAPAIQLSAAEDLWMTTTAGSAYGTWVTLGTVAAASRLVAVAASASTDGGLGTGATPTPIARWNDGSGVMLLFGQNRAVPTGDLKITGYTGSWAWVLTEPV